MGALCGTLSIMKAEQNTCIFLFLKSIRHQFYLGVTTFRTCTFLSHNHKFSEKIGLRIGDLPTRISGSMYSIV